LLLLLAAASSGDPPSAAAATTPASSASAGEPSVGESLPELYLDALTHKITLLNQVGTPEDLRAAADALEAALVDPRLADLTPKQQAAVHSGAAWVAVRANDAARARGRFAAAVRFDPEAVDDWLMLSQAELYSGHAEGAATALLGYAKLAPFTGAHKSFLSQVVRATGTASVPRFELLQRLFDANWTPDTVGASYFWYELALAHLHRGSRDAAAASIAKITNPEFIVRVRTDKRFDGLYDPASPAFDVERAARAEVDALKAAIGGSTEPTLDASNLLRSLTAIGALDEAVAFADRVLADPLASRPDAPAAIVAGVTVRRGYALRYLGREAESLAAVEAAAAISTGPRGNVNQTLDLAADYCSMGRGDDALRMAERAPPQDTNEFGRYMQQYAIHCAHVLRGDDAGAAKALAYLDEHRAQAPHAYQWALIRAGRADDAAASLIRELADERSRSDSLYALQEFQEPPLTPGDARLLAAWKQMIARPDVQAAVGAVGRIETYPIYTP
jgi:tetratricopeptide (TPR) repeat protein